MYHPQLQLLLWCGRWMHIYYLYIFFLTTSPHTRRIHSEMGAEYMPNFSALLSRRILLLDIYINNIYIVWTHMLWYFQRVNIQVETLTENRPIIPFSYASKGLNWVSMSPRSVKYTCNSLRADNRTSKLQIHSRLSTQEQTHKYTHIHSRTNTPE